MQSLTCLPEEAFAQLEDALMNGTNKVGERIRKLIEKTVDLGIKMSPDTPYTFIYMKISEVFPNVDRAILVYCEFEALRTASSKYHVLSLLRQLSDIMLDHYNAKDYPIRHAK
jgi:hypothetical protein